LQVIEFFDSRPEKLLKTKPVAILLITGGGAFSLDFGPFQGFKIGGCPKGCLGVTSIFKILTDDVALWSKLESTW